ncbi:MAG: FHA domain-containing protein [Nannocystaceae bacterium]|nr:FHA domain-containing protein [Nannocystaceae bacterium]
MTEDPPSQTLTVGAIERLHERRHIVVIQGEHTQDIELPEGAEIVFGRTHDADVRIHDRTLSRRHLKICVAKTVRATDLDSHNGTRLRGRALTPGTAVELISGDVLEAGGTTFIFRDEVAHAEAPQGGAWSQVQTLARHVQKTQLNVVIVGNPGSGRSTMAKYILGDTVRLLDGRTLDAEALDKLANVHEPLLLLHCDEVAPALQAPLARALEPRASRTVATAGRDPGVLAAKLDFYLPLHRALAGVVLRLPPLDRCKAEFDVIAEHLLRAWAQRSGVEAPRLAPQALEILCGRPWPGELRALVNTLEGSALGLRGPTINAADLRFPRERVPAGDPDSLERLRIIDALAACGGNQTQAAKLLKISRRTLVSRLDRYGIARPRKRISTKP